MGVLIVILLLAWVGHSLFRPSKSFLLKEAKSSYTSREVVDLVSKLKREAGLLYLVYGIGLGALTAWLFKD